MTARLDGAISALKWAGVVRRRWLRAATGPLAEVADARTPARARSLLDRAERRALAVTCPGPQISPLPDVAVRQLRDCRARGGRHARPRS